eukprot:GHVU01016261.1.p2 GENE.GHVU01016261.1~~GHVU01016261.1.p2  ORF type:complete len:111 (-),score=3.32 GHVU01016261.1:114-446(-)
MWLAASLCLRLYQSRRVRVCECNVQRVVPPLATQSINAGCRGCAGRQAGRHAQTDRQTDTATMNTAPITAPATESPSNIPLSLRFHWPDTMRLERRDVHDEHHGRCAVQD